MKKLSLFCIFVIVITTLTTVFSFARFDYIKENPPITMPYASPTIDGEIKETEGWSNAALLNDDTAGYFWGQAPLTSTANIYFAYDNNGIYYSADITEHGEAIRIESQDLWSGNSFIYSTDLDKTNDKGLRDYGFNGDVFLFAFDPLGKFIDEGYDGSGDYTPWYGVGLFKEGAKMYRSRVNEADITDKVKVSGKAKDNGWSFEAFIPWDIVIEDFKDISNGEITFTKEELLAAEATYRSTCIYMDRYINPETNAIDTWGRFIIVCETTRDGLPGNLTSGVNIKTYGLTLVVGKPQGDTLPPSTDSDKNNDDKNAQTLDIGIGISLGVIGLSGIGLGLIRKRKR